MPNSSTRPSIGLKQERSKKTSYKWALSAAAEAGVDRTEEAFVAFLKENGGIEGVQPGAPPHQSSDEKIAQALRELSAMETDGPPVEDTRHIVWIGDIGVGLHKRQEVNAGDAMQAYRIPFDCHKRVIIDIRAAIIRAEADNEQSVQRDIREAERTWIDLLWKRYMETVKKNRNFGETFLEWVDETGEYDLKDQKPEILTGRSIHQMQIPARYTKYKPKNPRKPHITPTPVAGQS